MEIGQRRLLDQGALFPKAVRRELEPVWASRERRALVEGTISVVSRAALVSMKLAAGREQDLVDVKKLSEQESRMN